MLPKLTIKALISTTILSLFLPSEIFAQTAPLFDQIPNFQELWSTPDGDNYSSLLFNQIFGPLFPSDGQPNKATLLSTVVGIVNGVFLGIAVILFLYNVIVATLQTAHEGTLFGGRYSSLWVPLRILFAFLLLVPAPGLSGYNIIQSSVAWLVKGSTVAASELWRLGASELISGKIPIVNYGSELDPELFKVVYRNQLCVSIANYQLSEAGSHLRVEFEKYTTPKKTNFLSQIGDKQEGICGSYSLPKVPEYIQKLPQEFSSTLETEFRNLHLEILNGLLGQVNQLIENQWAQFVVNSEGIDDFSGSIQSILNDLNATLAEGNTRINLLITGSNNTDGSARRVLRDYIVGANCDGEITNGSGGDDCRSSSWITAGNWYMTIARLNSEVIGLLKASIGATDTKYINDQKNSLNKTIVEVADEVSGFQRFFGSVNSNKYLSLEETHKIWATFNRELENSILKLSASGYEIPETLLEASATPGGGGLLGKVWQVAFANGVNSMIENLSPSKWGNDPIVGIVNIGNWYLDVAGILILGSAVSSIFAGSISTTITFLIAGPLAAIGISLSFILPLLPFFLWIIGIASYFLLVVEAIIGSTLWLLAHFRMDGDGLSGNFGQGGWLILLSLLLTPSLMVIGYFVGMILFKITTNLLDLGFYFAMSALVNASPIVGIFGLIATGFLLVIAYIAIIERSFSLIIQFPSRILLWIGGNVDLSGGQELSNIQTGGRVFTTSIQSGISQLKGVFSGGKSKGISGQ